MRRYWLTIAAAGMVLFVSGFALGHQLGSSRFANYLKPAEISWVEWGVLKAKVDHMANSTRDDLVGTPSAVFDDKAKKIKATALVDSRRLVKLSKEGLAGILQISGDSFFNELKWNFVRFDLTFSKKDVEVEYQDIRKIEIGQDAVIAAYKDGKIILR